MKIDVLSPAKINLSLNITGKREDGYHFVDMVMQTISLYDEISVEVIKNSSGINLTCDNADIPTDISNTAYKGAKYYLDEINSDAQVNISIHKNIPAQAGLAGGSSDGAGVLFAMNKAFENKLSQDVMLKLCAKIGADVPFCLVGGTHLATGIGTTLNKIKDMPQCFIVVVKPYINVSTKIAYERSDLKGYSKDVQSSKIIQDINNENIVSIAKHLYNDFEEVMQLEEVNNIKNIMMNNNAIGASMSGSGPSVYGIFTDIEKAEQCSKELKNQFSEVFITQPVIEGCKISN